MGRHVVRMPENGPANKFAAYSVDRGILQPLRAMGDDVPIE